MSPGVLEYQADKKRLEQSLLISMLIWILLMGTLAFIPIRPDRIPETSMNPIYIDLVPPAEPVKGRSMETEHPLAAGYPQPVAAQNQSAASASPTAQSSAAQSSAAPSSAVSSSTASSKASRSSTVSNPYQGRGGEDPFAPLSEADLAAKNPEAPASAVGPAQAPDGESGRVSSTAKSPGQGSSSAQTDALDQRIQSTTEALSERGGSGVGQSQAQGASGSSAAGKNSGTSGGSIGSGGASVSGTAKSGTAAGSLQSDMDFGEGPGRKLISAPPAAIPAKLLEGQPALLETTVRFRIDKGGTVIALSIQFDPPLPLDIAEYLKTYVFSRWVFSPSNSDGQVRFKYSIKVQ